MLEDYFQGLNGEEEVQMAHANRQRMIDSLQDHKSGVRAIFQRRIMGPS